MTDGIADLDEAALREVYETVHRLNRTREDDGQLLLDRLTEIHIQGPEEFSENIDDHLNRAHRE
jgi:hypothetical protein